MSSIVPKLAMKLLKVGQIYEITEDIWKECDQVKEKPLNEISEQVWEMMKNDWIERLREKKKSWYEVKKEIEERWRDFMDGRILDYGVWQRKKDYKEWLRSWVRRYELEIWGKYKKIMIVSPDNMWRDIRLYGERRDSHKVELVSIKGGEK